MKINNSNGSNIGSTEVLMFTFKRDHLRHNEASYTAASNNKFSHRLGLPTFKYLMHINELNN